MNRVVKIALVVIVLAFVFWFGVRRIVAQEAPKLPVLTEVEKLTIQNVVKDLQSTQKDLEPASLAAAITELIAARQTAANKARETATTYFQSLAKDGCQIDIQTLAYQQAANNPVKCGTVKAK